ncbi:uncharacterized protein SPSK_10172 [Sporothrix schenckii 1099-18]|uniref:Uncharacterized protein n=1 Tax=Sporothrix schenckii 1099-18 TaxID=1397361 RepID=A0A0F2M7Z8_SPOSC|nr:uncharacterized protein SPSK_10172 [Sporothrix schenckii 1099-18]KJR85767.1 hypothetical protein SPSK_10172 [Sporothrix schenckii 1099-18]
MSPTATNYAVAQRNDAACNVHVVQCATGSMPCPESALDNSTKKHYGDISAGSEDGSKASCGVSSDFSSGSTFDALCFDHITAGS